MTTVMGTIIATSMDLETARQHVQRINEHLDRADYHIDQARKLIWELKERGGWKVLGYASWHKCVKAEFQQSSASVYRQLNATLVEMELSPSGRIGEINERVLRPLTRRGYSTEAKQAIWAISQDIVGEGGKVTSGVVDAVIDGFKDMLVSGTIQDADGVQSPISEQMRGDLVARVRQVRLAHQDHIKRMGKDRDYLIGGIKITGVKTTAYVGSARIDVWGLDSLNIEKIQEAKRLGKPIYISLWTE